MKRKFFPFCALISLLLGVATVWWWTGSSARIDQLNFERNGSQSIRLWGSGGKILLTRTVYPAGVKTGSGQLAWSSTPYNPGDATGDPKLTLASFSYASQPLASSPGARETYLVLPAWLLTMVFALLPAMWVAMRFKVKKKPA